MTKEVTFDIDAGEQKKSTRVDLVGRDVQKNALAIEGKIGDFADLSDNQKEGYPKLASEGVTSRGGRAAAAPGVNPGTKQSFPMLVIELLCPKKKK